MDLCCISWHAWRASMQHLWVTYVLIYNSWLHPTTSALQQHTCTPPPHGAPQQKGWDEAAGLTFPPSYVSMCVLDQNILHIQFSCYEGVNNELRAQQRVSCGWGRGMMEVGGSRCLPAAAPLPRKRRAFTGLSETIIKAGRKE